MPVDYLGYLFGAMVAGGGAMGYVKKRSLPSLVAGLTFGGLAAAGAYHASQNPDNPIVGAGVSGLLGTVMGARAVRSGALMPAGLIAVMALGMFGRYSLTIYQSGQK